MENYEQELAEKMPKKKSGLFRRLSSTETSPEPKKSVQDLPLGMAKEQLYKNVWSLMDKSREHEKVLMELITRMKNLETNSIPQNFEEYLKSKDDLDQSIQEVVVEHYLEFEKMKNKDVDDPVLDFAIGIPRSSEKW